EVDTWFAIAGHVGSHIQFWKAREPGQRRKPASANSAHVKRHDPDPAPAIESVERHLWRHQRTHQAGWHRPVGEEEIVPDLLHHPWARRQGPWAMRCRLEQRVHSIV